MKTTLAKDTELFLEIKIGSARYKISFYSIITLGKKKVTDIITDVITSNAKSNSEIKRVTLQVTNAINDIIKNYKTEEDEQ